MAARTATARLHSLEQLNYGFAYRFTIEPHVQLEQRLLEWAGLRLYGVHIEYDAVTAGKKIYTISSDGMWLLSHLFENWEEMDMPPQAKHYQCDQCHLYSYTPPWQCPDCKKMFCSRCSAQHVRHKTTQNPSFTGRSCASCHERETTSDTFPRCRRCNQVFCPVCYAQHMTNPFHSYMDEQAPFTEEEFLRYYEQLKQKAWTYSNSQSSSSNENYRFQSSSSTSTNSIPATVREALKTLGITGTPTREQITRQYKKLAKEQHPDLGGDGKEMAKINHARDVALKWMKEQGKS